MKIIVQFHVQNGAVIQNKNFSKENGKVILTADVNIENVKEVNTISVKGLVYFNYSGGRTYGCDYITFKTDNDKPVCDKITVDSDNTENGFSRFAIVNAKFIEDWDKTVEMALYDSNGKAISNPEWQIATSEGNNVFSKTFNVVAESTTTKELTVKAKDSCGNIGEGKVTIGKIDTKAPTLVSPTNYNGTWTIGKEIKVEVTDEGAGEVEISLGDENDYQKATKQEDGKYTRTYHFTGELSDDIVRYVYVKDRVGNKTSYKLTIGKMDSTSPTVTNVSASGKTITVEANDMNTKLNKEGSGIKGYAVSKSKEVPSDNYFVKDKNLTVEESGTYYVWVKDNAGNLSEMKTVTIK